MLRFGRPLLQPERGGTIPGQFWLRLLCHLAVPVMMCDAPPWRRPEGTQSEAAVNSWWSGRFSWNPRALTHHKIKPTWRKGGGTAGSVWNGLSGLYRRPGLCFCPRCWVSQSFLLTEMSPGLLGIKTRPQLSQISLCAAHPPSRTHTEARTRPATPRYVSPV